MSRPNPRSTRALRRPARSRRPAVSLRTAPHLRHTRRGPVGGATAARPAPRAGFGDAEWVRVVHVGEACDCGGCDAPPLPLAERFGYTVGLARLAQPELLLRGVDAVSTAEVLNGWADLVLTGVVLGEGHVLCEGPGGRRWELREVRNATDILLWTIDADRRPNREPVRALELVPTALPCRCEEHG